MAEAAAQHSEGTPPHLDDAIHSEGMEPVGTVAHEGVAPHTDPKAVGMDATAWVSLAMAVFILILLITQSRPVGIHTVQPAPTAQSPARCAGEASIVVVA